MTRRVGICSTVSFQLSDLKLIGSLEELYIDLIKQKNKQKYARQEKTLIALGGGVH